MTSRSATEALDECGHVRCYGRRMVIWGPGFTSFRHKQHPGGLQDEDCGLSPGHLSITRNLSRRHPQKTFEPVRQMALVGIANGGRDVRDGDIAKQQLACALDSYVLQVRVRREPDLFLKSPGEIERAEMDERGGVPKAKHRHNSARRCTRVLCELPFARSDRMSANVDRRRISGSDARGRQAESIRPRSERLRETLAKLAGLALEHHGRLSGH